MLPGAGKSAAGKTAAAAKGGKNSAKVPFCFMHKPTTMLLHLALFSNATWQMIFLQRRLHMQDLSANDKLTVYQLICFVRIMVSDKNHVSCHALKLGKIFDCGKCRTRRVRLQRRRPRASQQLARQKLLPREARERLRLECGCQKTYLLRSNCVQM